MRPRKHFRNHFLICLQCAWMYFTEMYNNYSLLCPHDTDDIFKVMGSKVKVTDNISRKCTQFCRCRHTDQPFAIGDHLVCFVFLLQNSHIIAENDQVVTRSRRIQVDYGAGKVYQSRQLLVLILEDCFKKSSFRVTGFNKTSYHRLVCSVLTDRQVVSDSNVMLLVEIQQHLSCTRWHRK